MHQQTETRVCTFSWPDLLCTLTYFASFSHLGLISDPLIVSISLHKVYITSHFFLTIMRVDWWVNAYKHNYILIWSVKPRMTMQYRKR